MGGNAFFGASKKLRVKGPRVAELERIQAEVRKRCQERRDRVLKHEWACRRLCQIFGYSRAEQWNGYVPPYADPLPNSGPQLAKSNDSPRRAALVQLIRDVEHFENTGELPESAQDENG